MASGIKFYRDYVKVESLKTSLQTELFTKRFNNLFDVLNQKYPAEGIRNNSSDFQV